MERFKIKLTNVYMFHIIFLVVFEQNHFPNKGY